MAGNQPNARDIAVSIDPDHEYNDTRDPNVLPECRRLYGDRVPQSRFHLPCR
jgi:hypothetical protein